jgi:hypothetical protein
VTALHPPFDDLERGDSVSRHEHGIVVLGPVPVDEIIALMRVFEEYGYDWCDARIADHYGATLVTTDEEGVEQWREELGLEGDSDE